jgi:hypothetical protein
MEDDHSFNKIPIYDHHFFFRILKAMDIGEVVYSPQATINGS